MKNLFLCLILLSFGMGYALTGQADSDSATFDTVDPSVSVTAPLTDATWYIGYSYDIAWTASDTNFPAEPIQISYSTDGGTNYSVLEESNANSGTYPWSATVPASANAKVSLLATDSFGNSSTGENSGVFNVAYCPPPQISNVSVQQRTDGSKTVDVYYDLADVNDDLCTVSLIVSDDNGSTFNIIPTVDYLSGDVGNDINPGTGKHIVWVAGNESGPFDGSSFRVRVMADDGTTPPQP